MGRNRVDDLKNAKEVLNALKPKSTAKLVEAMEENVALQGHFMVRNAGFSRHI